MPLQAYVPSYRAQASFGHDRLETSRYGPQESRTLARLLLHMSGQVIGRIVDVHKSPVNDGDRLEDVLQTLTMASRVSSHSKTWGNKTARGQSLNGSHLKS